MRNLPELTPYLAIAKKYYGTTSFKSEIPLPYFSFAEYNIQNPAVSFQDGIKGASFLARNCQSMNDRENVVQQLMDTGFIVDALSSCLNNVVNPGFDLDNKGEVNRKYLFVSESFTPKSFMKTKLNLTPDSDNNLKPNSI